MKPLSLEELIEKVKKIPYFVPVLETREIYGPQKNIKTQLAYFDIYDIRLNDSYVYYLFGDSGEHFVKYKDYGVTWRCWDVMPTVKQSDACPWNEEKF